MYLILKRRVIQLFFYEQSVLFVLWFFRTNQPYHIVGELTTAGLGKGSGTAYIVVTEGGGAVARNTLLRIVERGRRVILQYGTRIDCNLWHEASFLFHLRSVGMQTTPFLCARMDYKLHLRAFIITCMQWMLLSTVNKTV